jgi:hypothetical protein
MVDLVSICEYYYPELHLHFLECGDSNYLVIRRALRFTLRKVVIDGKSPDSGDSGNELRHTAVCLNSLMT